jgi:hypothetical protein
VARRYITIMYSCDLCGLVDVTCQVREREDPDQETVEHYLNYAVTRAIAHDHQLRSFGCENNRISQLKIPMDNSDPNSWIGKYTPTLPPKGWPKEP